MWQTYYYKFIDHFTSPLFYVPRWFNSVGYPNLTDHVSQPGLTDYTTTLSGIVFTNTLVPSSLIYVNAVPSSSTVNLTQKFWNVFSAEKQTLYKPILSWYLSGSFFFDLSDPQFAWYSASDTPVTKLEVKRSDGSYTTISEATGPEDLFYSAEWKWYQFNNNILIYGLDLRESETEARAGDNWQFIKYEDWYSKNDTVYLRHPYSLKWIPIHPLNIRSDGFLNYISDFPLQLRAHVPSATLAATSITLKINGVEREASRINLRTSVDEKGVLFNLLRKDGELSKTFSTALIAYSWFANTTYDGVRNGISAALRRFNFSTFPASPNIQFTVPASSTGYTIRGHLPYQYVQEICVPDPNTTDRFVSHYVDNTLGILFLNGRLTNYSTDVSGYIVPAVPTYNAVDVARMRWKLTKWTQVGSTVTLSSAFRATQPLISVYFPEAVEVVEADTKIKRKSILRTYPGYRWQTFSLSESTETLIGMASFDF